MKPTQILVTILIATAVPARAGIRDDFLAEARALREAVAALDSAWYSRLPLLAEGEAALPRVVRLRLSEAIYDRDLHIELYRVRDEWVRALAWAPDWNCVEHRINSIGLTITGDVKDGSLSGRLAITLLPDGVVPLEGEPLHFEVTVNGNVTGGAVTGSYRTHRPSAPSEPPDDYKPPPTIPMSRGKLGGHVVALAANPRRPDTVPVREMTKWTLYEVYAEACRAEEQTVQLYHMIRGIDLARVAELPYSKAMHAALNYVPVRMAFDPPDVAKEKEEERSGPTLDDMGMGLLDELDVGPTKEANRDDGSKNPLAPEAVETLRLMRRRAQTLLAWVRDSPTELDQLPSYLTEGETFEDPHFGPWFGEESLPADDGGVTRLPPYERATREQRWPCVSAWRWIGPFVNTTWEAHTPLLPEIPGVAEDVYRVEVGRLHFHGKYHRGSREMHWKPIKPCRTYGYVCPPNVSGRNRVYWACPRAANGRHTLIEHSTMFARAVVNCEVADDYWVALGVCQRGKLWLNGRLFWVSPKLGKYESEQAAILRVPFRKGRNLVLLQCEVGYASPYYWVRICTAGRPRSADACARDAKRVAEVLRKRQKPGYVSGWRGTGNGVYPGAKPPLAWDYRKGHNLIWRTPLPYWSNGTPVPADDRLFVPVEPDLLVCLRKSDGKILWKRHCSKIDLLPEPDRKQAWALYEAWQAARKERDAIPAHVIKPRKWLGNSLGHYWNPGQGIWARDTEETDEREGASPELLELLDRRDELRKAEDPQAVADELATVIGKIDRMKNEARADDPAVQAAEEKHKALDRARTAFERFMSKHGRWGRRVGYWYDMDGRAFPTPVTDGDYVWWKNGTGVAGCYDMDGNRIWLSPTDGAQYGNDAISSPRLVGDKLICEVPNYPSKKSRRGKGMRYVAFDKRTGDIVWEARGLRRSGWGCATMTHTTLSDGETLMDVILTPGGSVIRADDGEVLVRHMGTQTHDASPQASGDIVVYPRSGMNVIRLLMKSRDVVGYKRLWTHPFTCDYGGVVLAGDRIFFGEDYGASRDATPSEFWQALWSHDLLKGGPLAVVPLYRKAGKTYGLSSATDDYLYMLNGEGSFMPVGGKMCFPKPPHTIVVTTREDVPVPLAVNAIERTFGQAVPDGNRLYVRGDLSIACIGYTGDEGRAYEHRVVAETLLDQIAAVRPVPSEALEPMPGAGWTKAVPYMNAKHGVSPGLWSFAGPFPLSAAGKGAQAFARERFLLAGQDEVTIGEATRPLCAFDRKHLPVTRFPGRDVDPANFTLVMRRRRTVDIGLALRDRAPCVGYLYSAIRCEDAAAFRFEMTTPGTKAWIGGLPVASGQRIVLAKGDYPFLVEITVKSVPESGLLLSPCLWASDDVAEEEQAWLRFVERFRPRFQAALDAAPGSSVAARARRVLNGL